MSAPSIWAVTSTTFEMFVSNNPRLLSLCTSGRSAQAHVEPEMKVVMGEGRHILNQAWRVYAQNIDWDLLATLAQEKVRNHQK